MFTGIVETMGEVTTADRSDGGMRMRVRVPDFNLSIGDSVAVNGVCLTAVAVDESGFEADLVLETLARTNLGETTTGDRVNLERPMPADGRFDGHIVQGHIDGVGQVVKVMPEGEGKRITIRAPQELSRYVAEKGSVAVDGVSLTVAAVDDDQFEIALIPHTLAVTTLGVRDSGSMVNLEVDVIAKYVERMMLGGNS